MAKNLVTNLKLTDLLRRRKANLRQYIGDFGITTYETLCERCVRIGVLPPSKEEFAAAAPPPVNSPPEGVVVLEAPPAIKESTGKPLDHEQDEQPTQEDTTQEYASRHEGEQVMFQRPSVKKQKNKKVETFELPPE